MSNIVGGNGTSVLNFYNTDNSTLSSNLSGSVSLNKYNENTLYVLGDITSTGIVTIDSGVIQIGNGGMKGSVTSDIFDKAELIFNRSDDVIYSGVIFGSGTVEKDGAGLLTLTGKNTYTGATTVSAGTLKTGVEDAFANTSGVTVSDG
ncbi:TPA: autotransporter-associated beta strand repeat-containing protein, partial [Kluyvera ascorbata]|nr:autotransporter-associated beta strand repeat-containing protein [Kluyvera ascorbata]